MDAVRIKHEADTKDAVERLGLSTAMHNIDLAVDRGKNAAPLNSAQQKTAELDNLEILVARISEQVYSRAGTGGTLGQVKEFNAFLERAFAALEAGGTGSRAW